MNRLSMAFKAFTQLGFQPTALYASYRLGLASGHYKRMTDGRGLTAGHAPATLRPGFRLPSAEDILAVLGDAGRARLFGEADEIAAGRVRLFGGEPVELKLAVSGPLVHWSDYESSPKLLAPFCMQNPDIKFLWEPARFGWAYGLGVAYHLGRDEKYAEAFWHHAETFLDANPPYLGPHWMSGQEVAIRLMAFVWAAQVFAGSLHSTPERLERLGQAVAAHAARIPPTLVYARSQNNNHLLTEAAGLFTAGLALADHPSSSAWRALGWKWLNEGLQSQIDGYGEYAQHSTNYHRLMLQVALWTDALLRGQGRNWPRQTAEALSRSVHWLLALLDPGTGRTPNLGANDGAYIFPVTVCPFDDFRPVLHAAARAFLRYDLPRGPWDDMAMWFGVPLDSPKYLQLPRYLGDQIYGKDSWAYLRTAQFSSRPSHADQLHVDLWRRGLNITQDAGTYLYNGAPPWDNALVTAFVHNTVTVDGRDQMRRAGRFLYLDWVNAYRRSRIEVDEQILQRLSGRHYGYMLHGVRHTRSVTAYAEGRWRVTDEMLVLRLPIQNRKLRFRLHWLFPDWEWAVEAEPEGLALRLKSPQGWITVQVLADSPSFEVTLARAGERVYGGGPVAPVMGWASPTYSLKVPALALVLEVASAQEVNFTSEFTFPKS